MSARFLLDTNICIYLIKGNIQSVRNRFAALPADALCISVITVGELAFGANKSQQPYQAFSALQQLTHAMPVVPLDNSVATHYGQIRASLSAAGQAIGANDLWIAAHARALQLTLVTNNVREFVRVPGLMVENWVAV